ncbi:unnamed protein product [Caenorhabditis auriculariae]|uniref:Uncharacterized protein n=1 Tax=Caenorhabditis auriculariae TaxID=2777116 RepID=A0A8S1HZP5_9PELO|nr:unnamed protein product [Caenorhabditis auriculariae]
MYWPLLVTLISFVCIFCQKRKQRQISVDDSKSASKRGVSGKTGQSPKSRTPTGKSPKVTGGADPWKDFKLKENKDNSFMDDDDDDENPLAKKVEGLRRPKPNKVIRTGANTALLRPDEKRNGNSVYQFDLTKPASEGNKKEQEKKKISIDITGPKPKAAKNEGLRETYGAKSEATATTMANTAMNPVSANTYSQVP